MDGKGRSKRSDFSDPNHRLSTFSVAFWKICCFYSCFNEVGEVHLHLILFYFGSFLAFGYFLEGEKEEERDQLLFHFTWVSSF